MPAGASSSSSSSSVSSLDPARKRYIGGYSSEEVSSSDSSSSSEDSTLSQDQASSLLFASSSPSTRNCRPSSPSVRDASSSNQAEKSQSLSSHHCGARVSYAAVGGCSGVGSRSLMVLEDWEERAEEEEAMAEEEGFFGGGRGFFGCWRKMGLQTAQMNLNKGNSGRWFNAIAVSQNAGAKIVKSCTAEKLRRHGIMMRGWRDDSALQRVTRYKTSTE